MVEITTVALITSIQALTKVIAEEDALVETMEEGDDLYSLAESVETYRKAMNELCGVYEMARANGAELPPLSTLIGPSATGDAVPPTETGSDPSG